MFTSLASFQYWYVTSLVLAIDYVWKIGRVSSANDKFVQ